MKLLALGGVDELEIEAVEGCGGGASAVATEGQKQGVGTWRRALSGKRHQSPQSWFRALLRTENSPRVTKI